MWLILGQQLLRDKDKGGKSNSKTNSEAACIVQASKTQEEKIYQEEEDIRWEYHQEKQDCYQWGWEDSDNRNGGTKWWENFWCSIWYSGTSSYTQRYKSCGNIIQVQTGGNCDCVMHH